MTTTRDLRHLGSTMRKVAIAIERDVTDFAKDVTVQVQSAVAEGTPVDKGVARSNWVVRAGSPWGYVYRAFAPGQELGRGERANLMAVQRQGVAAAAVATPGQPLYINNNVPYIGRLNSGYSSQSGAGFVQRGVSLGVSVAVSRFRLRNVERVI